MSSGRTDCLNSMDSVQSSDVGSSTHDRVAILLCTCNGQTYLVEQLDSLRLQQHKNWTVWVSDDASSDDTAEILQRYAADWSGQLSIFNGPSKGYAANFLSLACKPEIEADYFAFSDQDDIWETHKISRALTWLRTVPPDIPALYCSRTHLIDAFNHSIGLSPLYTRAPSFANALAQNIAGGNTMVFNNRARALLLKASKNIDVVSHDWWVYQVVTGCGGVVRYDDQPSVRYRQHDKNQIGNSPSILMRLNALRRGLSREWYARHIDALDRIYADLTPSNKILLDEFRQARNSPLVQRLTSLRRSTVHRQTLSGNVALWIAAIFKKI